MAIGELSVKNGKNLAIRLWKAPHSFSRVQQRIATTRQVTASSDGRQHSEKPVLNFLFDARGRIVYKVHDLWREHLQVGDLVVDATCGNGNDTWEICQAVLGPRSEWETSFRTERTRVVAIDIQQQAVDSTRGLLEHNNNDSDDILKYVEVRKDRHEDMLDYVPSYFLSNTKLVVFNLGYLPRGDKQSIITLSNSTLRACEASLKLLKPGGLLSILAYSGHEGGEEEFQAVMRFSKQLDPFMYHSQLVQVLTRPTGPHFIGIYKREL